MSSSTDQAVPKKLANEIPSYWRPNVSQATSASPRHFAPLTIEEKATCRKWRRATVMFYCAFALVISAFLIAGPTDPSTTAKNGAHSAIASVGQ